MDDESDVTDRLSVVGNTTQSDSTLRHGFLCSTRCRVTLYIFLLTTTNYLHRVNLSLAVVCIVGHSDRVPNLTTNLTASDSTNFSLNNDLPSLGNTKGGFRFNGSDIITSNGSDIISSNGSDAGQVSYGLANSTTSGGGEKIVTTASPLEENSCSSLNEASQDWTAELDWDKAEVSVLLSSYFYGCVITQIPAGVLADRFGGKHLMTAAMALTGACAVVTPVFARTSIYLVFVVRVLIGMAGGVIFPVAYALVTMWAPPSERGMIIGLVASGSFCGIIISYLTSGLLCAYGFDNGWPSIFYIHGGVGLLVLCVWVFDSASTPSQHPRISPSELQYIHRSTKHKPKSKPRRTPWRALLTSRALWASFVTQVTFNWSFFTVLINVPMFMKEVLKFSITQNGLFSALPYLVTMVSILASGKLSQVVIGNGCLGVLATRRIFTASSLLGSGACLVLVGHLTCELRPLSVGLLCVASLFFGMSWGGLFINHPEFAGQFSGTALGITNAGGILSALLASMFAGLMTPNSSPSEWQTVFYIAAGLNLVGALTFSLWSRAKLEPWAAQHLELTVTVDEDTLQIRPLKRSVDEDTLQIRPLKRSMDEDTLQIRPLKRPIDEDTLQIRPLKQRSHPENHNDSDNTCT